MKMRQLQETKEKEMDNISNLWKSQKGSEKKKVPDSDDENVSRKSDYDLALAIENKTALRLYDV